MRLKKWMEMLFCNENVNAILLFLVGMAIITVVARMADSFMAPQVVVGSPQEMRLQYPMEIEGQICAKGKQAMYCRENLRIAQVMVQKGDTVEKGDLLFTIDKESLQEQIRQTEQEIQKGSLQIEDLEQAYRKQAAQQSQDYSRAKEDYQDAQRSAEKAVNAAYLEMERARQELAQHDSAKPKEMPEQGGSAKSEENQEMISQKERESEQEAPAKPEENQEVISPKEGESEQETSAKPEKDWEMISQKEDESEQEKIETPGRCQETALKKEEKTAYEAETGNKESEEPEAETGNKEGEEPEAETGNKEGEEPEAADAEGALVVWSQRREELAQQYAEKQKLYEEAMDSKDASLKAAARQVEDCSREVSKDHAQTLLQMDQEDLSYSLQRLKEIEQADGKIYAELDGKISECNVSTGAVTSPEPVLIFEDLTQPLQFEGWIDKLSRSRVKEGIECSLKINGEPVLIEGLKISKVTEEASEQGNYLVIAEIHSDSVRQTGEAVLSFTQESQLYQDCIPVSSLYTGNAGNYIMGIKEDITILGIQAVAEMIPVTPIEENGEYVAVKEHLSAYDAIVISASKSIKEGDRIRITEE